MAQIDIPADLRMQVTARDIEYRNALSRFVPSPPAFPAPYYAKSPYALGGVRGLGNPVLTYGGCVPYDYYGFLEAFRAAGLIEDCGMWPFGDVAGQFACQQRNQPTINKIQSWAGTCISPSQLPANYVPTPGSSGDPNLATGQIVAIGPAAGGYSSPPANTGQANTGTALPSNSASSPSLQFTTSRGSTTLYPGDTWQIRITGSAPNAIISVSGVHNGQTSVNQMGSADASGNYTKTGTIDAYDAGGWQETWYAGSAMAGVINFTVTAAPNPGGSQQPQGTQPSGGQNGGGAQGTTLTPGAGTSSGTGLPATTGNTIFGVPSNYVMLGGAAVILLALMGGRR